MNQAKGEDGNQGEKMELEGEKQKKKLCQGCPVSTSKDGTRTVGATCQN